MAAAESLVSAANHTDRIARYVANRGRYGATRDEIGEALDLPIQSVCPAVKAMTLSGRLVSTSRKRPTRSGRPAVVVVAPRYIIDDGGDQ